MKRLAFYRPVDCGTLRLYVTRHSATAAPDTLHHSFLYSFYLLPFFSFLFFPPFFSAAVKRLRQTLIKLRIAYNLTIRSYVSF